MSPQAAKKLERILALLIERDKILAELDAILNPAPDNPADTPPARANGKKQRLCKACGKPGHRSDTCPNKSRKEHGNDKWQELDENAPRPLLTRSQFRDIKESIKRGMGSKDLAAVMKQPQAEINKAVLAPDYDAYCNQ